MNNQLSKEQIKDRLLNRAAKQWGYSDVELENGFDPIVNLLFDVCSKELEKMYNEIFSSRRRITERLVEILTPTSAIKATPARAIMQAFPTEEGTLLNDHHQFFYQKKITNPYNPSETKLKSYFFGPTAPVRLNRNQLRYVMLPHGLQEINKGQYRESVNKHDLTGELPYGTMWLGLKPEESGILKNLMFYFHQKDSHHRDTFFYFLSKTEWYVNDHLLSIRQGLNTGEPSNETYHNLIQDDYNHLEKIEEHVNSYFEKQFITVEDVINIDSSIITLPDEFKNVFSEETYSALDKEALVWIKIKFPKVISNEMINAVYCAHNCFPVINKKLNETQGNIKKLLNIYPLHTNDSFFLELHSAMDDKNREYEIMTKQSERIHDDYAYLRFGGVTRFDERNASEIINYLIDLVRDESASFSKLGQEFTESNLNEINQVIARFRDKMTKSGMLNKTAPYLVLNTKNNDSRNTLFAKYWTTDGDDANKINTFSKLNIFKGADFEKGSLVFVSSTQGGKNELTNSDKIYAYRENLISNQRIVTKQDIKILCQKHYREAIKSVNIKNGIETSLNEHVGYTPTIDLFLERNQDINYTENEWNFLRDDLLQILKNRALNIVPFRIIYH